MAKTSFNQWSLIDSAMYKYISQSMLLTTELLYVIQYEWEENIQPQSCYSFMLYIALYSMVHMVCIITLKLYKLCGSYTDCDHIDAMEWCVALCTMCSV